MKILKISDEVHNELKSYLKNDKNKSLSIKSYVEYLIRNSIKEDTVLNIKRDFFSSLNGLVPVIHSDSKVWKNTYKDIRYETSPSKVKIKLKDINMINSFGISSIEVPCSINENLRIVDFDLEDNSIILQSINIDKNNIHIMIQNIEHIEDSVDHIFLLIDDVYMNFGDNFEIIDNSKYPMVNLEYKEYTRWDTIDISSDLFKNFIYHIDKISTEKEINCDNNNITRRLISGMINNVNSLISSNPINKFSSNPTIPLDNDEYTTNCICVIPKIYEDILSTYLVTYENDFFLSSIKVIFKDVEHMYTYYIDSDINNKTFYYVIDNTKDSLDSISYKFICNGDIKVIKNSITLKEH